MVLAYRNAEGFPGKGKRELPENGQKIDQEHVDTLHGTTLNLPTASYGVSEE